MVKTFSIIIPVYRNAESINLLVESISKLTNKIENKLSIKMDVIFVIDGCPENSFFKLSQVLKRQKFKSKLLLHSRNFGSFAAIRSGFEVTSSDYIAIMSADLQEPLEIIFKFLYNLIHDKADIVVGVRLNREDTLLTKLMSGLFWKLYKLFIVPDIPKGGVDIFGCNKLVYKKLLELNESHSSLIAQLYWLGFRRKEIGYNRLKRQFGSSAWTFKKKLKYFFDSVFSFTDIPIRILSLLGIIGLFLSLFLGVFILYARLIGDIDIPGYATTILIILFFGALNTLGLGIVGTYAWRGYENTKKRPQSLVMLKKTFGENRE